jgi:integrase
MLIRVPKPPRRAIEPWSAAEAKTFLKATRSHRLHAAFTNMLMLGLRRGEALGVSWNDLDLDAGVLRLRHQIQRGAGGLVLQDLKTEESAVTLPVPGPLLDVLVERYEIQDYEKARPDWTNWRDASLVTTTLDGAPIDPRNLNRAFVTETGKAALRRIRVHDTRHACASLLRSYGVDLAVIQRILRHTQLSTTADVYLHVNTDDQRTALNLIANALDHTAPHTEQSDTATDERDQQDDEETDTAA